MTIAKGEPAQPSPHGGARPAPGAATCPTTARPRPPRSSAPARRCSTRAATLKRTRIGADVLCEALLRQGVDVFFSYPGGVILPLYDVLGDYPELRHILVRHEQGGAHAADGYARVTGRVGVCMGTSGPGATNLVTGIGTALLDSVPMVAITGNVPGGADRQGRLPGDRHQRHHPADDQAQLPGPRRGRPAARRRRGVPHRPDRPARARSTSTSPRTPSSRRRGPQHPTEAEVDRRPARLPAEHGRPSAPAQARPPPRSPRPSGRSSWPATASSTPRPGTSCVAFAEKTQIPVAWTLLGIGAIDETHPLAYGYMGMHGWKHVNRAIQSADLLIAIGMRFDDRVTGNVRTYAPYARIIHVDIDPAEIGKNVAVEVPIVGDAKRVLQALTALVDAVDPATRADYFAQLAEWKTDSVASSWHGSGAWRDGLLSADYVVERIGELTDHAGDLRRRRRPEPDVAGPLRRLPPARTATSARAASGTMGFCRPGGDGRGARPARPRDLGDHRRRRLPDDVPGADDPGPGPHPGQDRALRQQEARDDPPVAGDHLRAATTTRRTCSGPDFAKLADAFGIPAFRARTPDEVDAAIRAAQAVDGPALIWFEIAEEQNIFPMMPAGKGLSDLIEKWGGADE